MLQKLLQLWPAIAPAMASNGQRWPAISSNCSSQGTCWLSICWGTYCGMDFCGTCNLLFYLLSAGLGLKLIHWRGLKLNLCAGLKPCICWTWTYTYWWGLNWNLSAGLKLCICWTWTYTYVLTGTEIELICCT
jgi:hypothetical protein